jgi:hypothetical protein
MMMLKTKFGIIVNNEKKKSASSDRGYQFNLSAHLMFKCSNVQKSYHYNVQMFNQILLRNSKKISLSLVSSEDIDCILKSFNSKVLQFFSFCQIILVNRHIPIFDASIKQSRTRLRLV